VGNIFIVREQYIFVSGTTLLKTLLFKTDMRIGKTICNVGGGLRKDADRNYPNEA